MRSPKLQEIILVTWLCGWSAMHAMVSWQTRPPEGVRSFNSPDETANYFFAERIAAGLPLAAPALEFDSSGVVHPRSMLVYGGRLVPATFVGLPVWYGNVGRLLGVWVMPYLTPLLAALGAWSFYRLLSVWFGISVAWWSAFLLPMLPPWWYYAARGLFPNVPFLALVLLGACGVMQALRHQKKMTAVLGGMALGAAVSLRPIEVIWIFPALAVALWYHRRRWPIFGLVAVGVIVALLPILVYQAETFGHALGTGYLLPPASGAGSGVMRSAALFPFGFHPRRALAQGWRFTVQLLPVLSWPALLGMLVVLARQRGVPTVQRWYLVFVAVSAAWLVGYYGSATVADNLDVEAVTLAVSFARYWLPLWLALLPLAVIGGQFLLARVPGGFGPWAGLAAVVAVFGWSLAVTVWEPADGLLAVRRAVQSGYGKRERVARLVPSDAIIVAERSDKIFFPVFPVSGTLLGGYLPRALPALVERRPVYWYTFLDDGALPPVRQSLAAVGMRLGEPTVIAPAEQAPERLFPIQNISP